MRVVGMISGTSMDGIDVAIADLNSTADGAVTLRAVGAQTYDWPPDLRRRLMALLPPAKTTIEEVARLDILVGEALAELASRAITEMGSGAADLIASHGQTVFHWVEGDHARGTLQLGQPAPIAEATGLPVVSDLRSRDIAAGGQGAPLASTLDVLLLRARGGGAALNLGGIANVTVVPPDGPPVAFDTGPASCLIDATVSRLSNGAETYDRDGERAARGRVDHELLAAMLTEPFYAVSPPKSTGRELFTGGYVEQAVERLGRPVADDDLIATLTELTAVTVAGALAGYGIAEVFASGGGVHNPVLRRALQQRLGDTALRTTDELGLPVDAKEAYLVALIGYLTWTGAPGVLPGLTGSTTAHALGRITPPTTSPVPTGLTILG